MTGQGKAAASGLTMRRVLMAAAWSAMTGAMFAAGGAQAASDAVTIGVLTDKNSIYAEFGGEGSVVAAKLAIEDHGGKALGKPVTLVSADHQNKADVGLAAVRKWYDVDGVNAVFDVLNSGMALPIQLLAAEKDRLVFVSGANNRDLNGKSCSPHGYTWGYDSYSLSKAVVSGLMKQYGDKARKWFFITLDYAAGHNIEIDSSDVVKANGGEVVGSARYSLGTNDFASILLKAQASGADVIGLATGGRDLQNIIKQAREFGLQQKIATIFMTTTDIQGLGLEMAKGLPMTVDYYWDRDDGSRHFAERFRKIHGKVPTNTQASVYSAVNHYLKAVDKAGTTETKKVIPVLNEMLVNDAFTKDGKIRADGRMMRDMYYAVIKTPQESKAADDFAKIVTVIPADQAFRPASQSECPALQAKPASQTR
ncbi:ABC transporter permease [Camelimonas fluminis]|uniref:ABC transporter substrate-binding protein n=1 Tax=Camelimonas fluminis TaxID=1576911 RepID=A0ABV7UDX7_9HYPH|nr:ABC transporter substrate-binding protein [Camelimonas fluminis]GHE52112.1 ABC transporter permease [Camelimonas fluminis]